MNNRMGRLKFAIRILLNYGSDKNCPFCQSTKTDLIARKVVILQLRRCKSCGLMFRWPKEDPGFSERFYQDSYQQVGTTDLPDPVILKTFIANNFAAAPREFADQIGVLKTFLPQGRVLDFGCSWGYGVYQLKRAGYDAFGFDISRPRAEFGRRELGVEILDKLEDLQQIPSQSVDGVFASHVLEHLHSLKEIFEFFARILKPSGVVFIMVPNSAGKKARELGVRWQSMINEKHTLALDGNFFEVNMAPFGFDVSSFSDTQDATTIQRTLDRKGQLSTEGEELRVIGRRCPQRQNESGVALDKITTGY
jgi:2-polyprenyl-3-methyl-5-hydroxy-6-metoxy-1,4-benzoquinol methylase